MTEEATAEAEEEDDYEGEDDIAPEPPPQLSESDLDDMEQSEIEAACFQGSRAACDRLGH